MNMRGFKLAGQLGEVMRGSAEIAYRYVIGNGAGFGIENNFFEGAFIPLHAPARITPRDSSSAGITTANALLSLGRERRVARRVAMAGRVDAHRARATRGRHRENVVAARRADCKGRSCRRTITATSTHCPNTPTRALTPGTRYTIYWWEVAPALPLSDDDRRPRSS